MWSEFFCSQTLLSEGKQQKLKESGQAIFYELIFRHIPEKEFAVLYSNRDSRPNAPAGTLVAALILKHRHSWSYEELFEHIDVDLERYSAAERRNEGGGVERRNEEGCGVVK